jgi:glyoxylase-like metal-dependent hydrolase (beta-lactamase superfamily II)
MDMENTDIFVTHLHADHFGLVPQIAGKNTKVYMGGVDRDIYIKSRQGNKNYWEPTYKRFIEEGYPVKDLELAYENNAAKKLGTNRFFETAPVEDGEIIRVGDIYLRCIFTPGHTPGHMCLYNESDKSLFLGDHVLYDITPNITNWPSMENALGEYLKSLDKIRKIEAARTFPAHRGAGPSLQKRVDELVAHHDRRLKEAERIIAAEPGIKGYAVASKMSWSIRAKNWQDIPPAQKWFAVGGSSVSPRLPAGGKPDCKGCRRRIPPRIKSAELTRKKNSVPTAQNFLCFLVIIQSRRGYSQNCISN